MMPCRLILWKQIGNMQNKMFTICDKRDDTEIFKKMKAVYQFKKGTVTITTRYGKWSHKNEIEI